MNKKYRTSVELKQGQSKKLQAIAAKLGYLQSRGVGAFKTGSIAQLMQAIADGEIVPHPQNIEEIVPHPQHKEEIVPHPQNKEK